MSYARDIRLIREASRVNSVRTSFQFDSTTFTTKSAHLRMGVFRNVSREVEPGLIVAKRRIRRSTIVTIFDLTIVS